MTTQKERIEKMCKEHPERIPLIEEARRKIKSGEVKWEIEKHDILVGKSYAANLCPICGITLERVMMYCCPNQNCPTGLGYNVTC